MKVSLRLFRAALSPVDNPCGLFHTDFLVNQSLDGVADIAETAGA
jgi:hypothetical protein